MHFLMILEHIHTAALLFLWSHSGGETEVLMLCYISLFHEVKGEQNNNEEGEKNKSKLSCFLVDQK